MRRWCRATPGRARSCGLCGAEIPTGEPMQHVTLRGVQRTLVRCEACVGSPAPPELPTVIELHSSAALVERVWAMARQALRKDADG